MTQHFINQLKRYGYKPESDQFKNLGEHSFPTGKSLPTDKIWQGRSEITPTEPRTAAEQLGNIGVFGAGYGTSDEASRLFEEESLIRSMDRSDKQTFTEINNKCQQTEEAIAAQQVVTSLIENELAPFINPQDTNALFLASESIGKNTENTADFSSTSSMDVTHSSSSDQSSEQKRRDDQWKRYKTLKDQGKLQDILGDIRTYASAYKSYWKYKIGGETQTSIAEDIQIFFESTVGRYTEKIYSKDANPSFSPEQLDNLLNSNIITRLKNGRNLRDALDRLKKTLASSDNHSESYFT